MELLLWHPQRLAFGAVLSLTCRPSPPKYCLILSNVASEARVDTGAFLVWILNGEAVSAAGLE